MYCRFCGSNLPDNSCFCGRCGKEQQISLPKNRASWQLTEKTVAEYGLALVLLFWALVPLFFMNKTDLVRAFVFTFEGNDGYIGVVNVISFVSNMQNLYNGILAISVLAAVLLLLRHSEGIKIAKIAAVFHGVSIATVGGVALMMKSAPALLLTLVGGRDTPQAREVMQSSKGIACVFCDWDWARLVTSFIFLLGLMLIVRCFKEPKTHLSKPMWGIILWGVLTPMLSVLSNTLITPISASVMSSEDLGVLGNQNQSFISSAEGAWLIPLFLLVAVVLFHQKNGKVLFWLCTAVAGVALLVDVYTGFGSIYLEGLFSEAAELAETSQYVLFQVVCTIGNYAVMTFWLIAIARAIIPFWMSAVYCGVSLVLDVIINCVCLLVLNLGVYSARVTYLFVLLTMMAFTIITFLICLRKKANTVPREPLFVSAQE